MVKWKTKRRQDNTVTNLKQQIPSMQAGYSWESHPRDDFHVNNKEPLQSDTGE
jgi:hypothetical protein